MTIIRQEVHMNYTVEWLTPEEAPEALDFLNMVFSMASRPHQFQAMLPKMWEYEGLYNTKHLALKVDGKIKSLLGVYPIPVNIAGEKLLFSTVGNVATHPAETGKGYMSILLAEAMKKLEELGADASRLGGKRERYNRYGYEAAGIQYHFTLFEHNVRHYYGKDFKSRIGFEPIAKTDEDKLLFAKSLFERSLMWVDRMNATIFYDSVTAWQNIPYLALRGGKPIGYLTATPDKGTVTEVGGLTTDDTIEILSAWLRQNELGHISVPVDPWQVELIRRLQNISEGWTADIPSQFYIRHWDKMVYAFMKLQNRLSPLADGELCLGIEGYGSLHMKVTNGVISVIKDESQPDLTLKPLDATRFLFGMAPSYTVCDIPQSVQKTVSAWLPLPLGWNTLDRV